jgi:pimeloyl-ACP methyl ester carboxylesterase
MAGRDIFVFIDGTGCDREHNSNIAKLCKAFEEKEKSDPNIVPLYERGVDQYAGMSLVEGALALGIRRQVINVYDRLVDQAISGDDRIHILGYSRGAIAAMILARMLSDDSFLGMVIRKQNLKQSVRAKVTFLGLFDPVVGYVHNFRSMFNGHELKPSTDPSVSAYVELLSLDERRLWFPAKSALKNYDQFLKKRNDYPEALALQVAPASKARLGKVDIDFQRQHAELARLPRHFVLLPGVHGEIGGQGGDGILNSVSIQTMLALLKASSPYAAKLNLDDLTEDLNPSAFLEIQIGKGASFKDKLRNIRRRRFPKSDNIMLHSIIDELVGKRGVVSHRVFSRWRKYKLPKALTSARRLPK